MIWLANQRKNKDNFMPTTPLHERRTTDINSIILAEKLTHLDATLNKLATSIEKGDEFHNRVNTEVGVLQERQKVANARIDDIEDSLKKVMWIVVTAVLVGLLGLVIK